MEWVERHVEWCKENVNGVHTNMYGATRPPTVLCLGGARDAAGRQSALSHKFFTDWRINFDFLFALHLVLREASKAVVLLLSKEEFSWCCHVDFLK